jgi:hypothetical protein
MEAELTCKCGGKMFPEDRDIQFERIRIGMVGIFPKESTDKIRDYTRNFIGFGPNYMYRCQKCEKLIKFIPDGRHREYD